MSAEENEGDPSCHLQCAGGLCFLRHLDKHPRFTAQPIMRICPKVQRTDCGPLWTLVPSSAW